MRIMLIGLRIQLKQQKANRQYCIDNKDKFKTYNENSWGLTACLSPKRIYKLWC